MKMIINKLKNPQAFLISVINKTFPIWNIKYFLKIKYHLKTGIKLDLDNPKTFNQKLQWLKLNDRNPAYTDMVDKVKAKEYVADIIGEKYIIPTLGVWESFDEIDFDKLPERFVLKTNHDSGGVVICRNKTELNRDKTRRILTKSLKRNYYYTSKEWPYKNVERRILAESFMEEAANKGGDLRDFKFYCFNGKPEYCQVISDRNTDEKIDFYDMEWQRIEGLVGLNPKAHNSDSKIERPASFFEMRGLVKKIAEKVKAPFCRIDFYDVEGKPYFGEITFYPASGFGKFSPDEWNMKMGEKIKLPID